MNESVASDPTFDFVEALVLQSSMTQEVFLEKLKNNEHFVNGYFKVISDYECDKCKVLVETAYGVCACFPYNLYSKNSRPTISTAIDKNEFYSNYIKAYNNSYKNGLFDIISDFIGFNKDIFVKTKYGIHKLSANSLKRGEMPGIKSAVDQLDYIHNLLLDKNEFYRDGLFKVVGYKRGDVTLEDPYGKCVMCLSDLYNNHQPTILSAINKTGYIKNKFKNLLYYDNYEYSKFIYNCATCKSIITCKKHGDFEQTPSKHLENQGCVKCGKIRVGKSMLKNPNGWNYTNWQKAGDRSKNFDSFKVYIVRCWNEDEEFYKIGKTFVTVEKRFRVKSMMPYNYEIVSVDVFDTSREASEYEDALQKLNKKYSYTPNIIFNGSSECFSDYSLSGLI